MKHSDYDTKHIKVLDGIRALAILIICWFHFWQQSWIIPDLGFINLDIIPRYGFLLVDMMILLSGFCLFIPYARSMVYKEDIPDTKRFYIKRIARIFPSYFISLIVAFIFVILLKDKWFNPFFIKDTLMHIFFVHNWSLEVLTYTNYIGALWTVAVEVQFYLLFPFIAKRFIKKPIITYIIMMVIGIISTIVIRNNVNDYNLPYYVNHFLTFIPVFANGMLACLVYIIYTKNSKRSNIKSIVFTIISILMVVIFINSLYSIDGSNIILWQIDYRILLSFIFMAFVISTCLASKIYQKLFNNKVMKFIAVISFNLYIYHAFIAVKLKEFRIPFYSGDTPPNLTGDTIWQWKYFILCIVISIIVAIMMTYLVEKPINKYLKKKYKCSE